MWPLIAGSLQWNRSTDRLVINRGAVAGEHFEATPRFVRPCTILTK